jgi:hypothetical protein
MAPGTKTWLLTFKSIFLSSPIPFTIVLWLLARNISFKHRKRITLVHFPILIWLLARKHGYLHLLWLLTRKTALNTKRIFSSLSCFYYSVLRPLTRKYGCKKSSPMLVTNDFRLLTRNHIFKIKKKMVVLCWTTIFFLTSLRFFTIVLRLLARKHGFKHWTSIFSSAQPCVSP